MPKSNLPFLYQVIHRIESENLFENPDRCLKWFGIVDRLCPAQYTALSCVLLIAFLIFINKNIFINTFLPTLKPSVAWIAQNMEMDFYNGGVSDLNLAAITLSDLSIFPKK